MLILGPYERPGRLPWSEIPIWIDPDLYGIHSIDISKAANAGLTSRPIIETIVDTWEWMQSGGQPRILEGRSAPGVSGEKEQAALIAWASQNA